MKNNSVYRSLTTISQFGMNMVVPIFMASFLGMFLDEIFHTSFLMIVFFFMGAIAGFRNIYILAKKIMNFSEKEASRNARKSKELPKDQ